MLSGRRRADRVRGGAARALAEPLILRGSSSKCSRVYQRLYGGAVFRALGSRSGLSVRVRFW